MSQASAALIEIAREEEERAKSGAENTKKKENSKPELVVAEEEKEFVKIVRGQRFDLREFSIARVMKNLCAIDKSGKLTPIDLNAKKSLDTDVLREATEYTWEVEAKSESARVQCLHFSHALGFGIIAHKEKESLGSLISQSAETNKETAVSNSKSSVDTPESTQTSETASGPGGKDKKPWVRYQTTNNLACETLGNYLLDKFRK